MSLVKLIDVRKYDDAVSLLWHLLEQRDPIVNISHKQMPSWDEHVAFVTGYRALTGPKHDYESWYIVEVEGIAIGATYLTWRKEIGIHLFEEHRGHGYGRRAVLVLMTAHGPAKYVANIAPDNVKSQVFFRKMGFKCIQHTFALEVEQGASA